MGRLLSHGYTVGGIGLCRKYIFFPNCECYTCKDEREQTELTNVIEGFPHHNWEGKQ